MKEVSFLGQRIAALEWGTPGAEPVLAVHGWLDNAASFSQLLDALDGVYPQARQQIHLIAVDLPGHGRSAWRDESQHYPVGQYVNDVLAVADELQWRSFTLLGHSLGAAISTLVAGVASDRIRKLLLIESLGPLSTAWSPSVLKVLRKPEGAEPKRSVRYFKDYEQAALARMNGLWPLSRQAADRLIERGVSVSDKGLKWSHDPRLRESTKRMTEEEVISVLAGLSMPVHLLLGDQGNIKLWPVMAQRRAVISHLQVAQLPGGHHLHLEDDTGKVADWFWQGLREGKLLVD
ncbi:alpha/beta hydrolase [Pokkaliibacter sp. MBI-7]|uniref:alpha/beta fold hydrolase n=1 Tax=Pokkaliibacter sp. MBI-7 TaxID=3040600 RepID=UPI00244A0064|nr:alpha/beta hydrolase [Pokkaliibacter sp. MBI-7]MDH2436085.1 alpha/beta hydrolase [Pokkaliibacter sp. MBI-7]